MNYKSIKYYRLYFAIVSLLVLLLLVSGISQVIVYFSTGADRNTILNVFPDLPETHVPNVTWLPDDPATARKMEFPTRIELMRDYINCWHYQELSYLNNKSIGIKDYFTVSSLPKVVNVLENLKKNNLQLHQTDVQHHINLHFFSADGQIVSFTDKRLLLKQRLYRNDTGEKVFSGQSLNDYDVVMQLDDGHWRINNWRRKPPSTLNLAIDSLQVNKEGMIQVQGNHFYLNNEIFEPKGINYYPQKTPWNLFWAKYNAKVTEKDFAIIHELGFNTVRIFINFQDFNRGNVPSERLDQLQNLLDIAQKNGIKVIITLFDFMGDYSLLNLTASDRQLETLLEHFYQHPAIFAWDLKNEPDLDYKYHALDDVNEWLTWTLDLARKYDPNHLFTVGWAFPENAANLSNTLDFVSFHSYRNTEILQSDLEKLQKIVTNKPILLEEFGLSTYQGFWAPLGKSEEEQANYYTTVRTILKNHGNLGFVAWTLYDFPEVPAEVVGKMPWNKNPQKKFGIISDDGKLKPAARILGK